MPYTTPEEVRGRLSFVGPSDKGSAAGVTDAQLLEAIEDARVEIDAKLAVRYPTPFDDPNNPGEIPTPPLIKRINRDIAAYLATLTFLKGAPLSPEAPVALRNASAQAMLTGISKGTVTLDLPGGVADEQPADNSAGAAVVNQFDGTMFSPCQFGIGPRGPGPLEDDLY